MMLSKQICKEIFFLLVCWLPLGVLIGLAIVVVVVTIGWCVLELDWEGGYIGDSKMELEIQ